MCSCIAETFLSCNSNAKHSLGTDSNRIANYGACSSLHGGSSSEPAMGHSVQRCTCTTIPAPGSTQCKTLSVWDKWDEQVVTVMNLILHLWYVAIASQWLWCTTYQVSFLCLLRQLNRAGNTICNDTALVKEPGECTLPGLLLKGILKLLWVSKWCNGCNRKASHLLDRSVELEKTGRGLKLSDGALKNFSHQSTGRHI